MVNDYGWPVPFIRDPITSYKSSKIRYHPKATTSHFIFIPIGMHIIVNGRAVKAVETELIVPLLRRTQDASSNPE